MVRQVFFSFHYENDIVRVSTIRNSGTFKAEGQPFLDKAEWESIKRNGETAVKNWITKQMKGTSVIVVCFGEETSNRKWVKYEVKKAYEEGRGLLAIDLSGMKDFSGTKSKKGKNPLDTFYIEKDGQKQYLSDIFPTYNWISDDGYNNIQDWIEEAAGIVGR